MIGIAVGSQSWQIVKVDGTVIPAPPEKKEGEEAPERPEGIPASRDGFAQVMAEVGDDRKTLIAGNRRWAKALAYALKNAGVEVRYLGGERAAGQKTDNVKILKAALAKNFPGFPFFRKVQSGPAEETGHPWIELAARYELANDEIRRAKHRVLDALRLLFPELLSLEEKLWKTKSLEALRGEQWAYFLTEGVDHTKSLGGEVPFDEQDQARTDLADALKLLADADAKKATVKSEIINTVGEHAAPKAYNDSFTCMMVTLLVGWKTWGRNKKGWRQLRAYAGFSVTRIDAKGKARINRRRPEIRVNLFHLMKTGRGKEVMNEAMTRLGKTKMRRIERMEYILKDIWRLMVGKAQPVMV